MRQLSATGWLNFRMRAICRRAEITYHLDNMEVHIPAGAHATGASPAHAIWKFNGAVDTLEPPALERLNDFRIELLKAGLTAP